LELNIGLFAFGMSGVALAGALSFVGLHLGIAQREKASERGATVKCFDIGILYVAT